MFYLFAPFYKILGPHPESLGVAAASMNATAFAIAVTAAGVASGRRAAWATAIGSVGLAWAWGFDYLDRIWNPFLVLAPMLGIYFACAALAAGHRWFLVIVSALSSFVVQTHVGALPPVAAAGAYALIGGAWSTRRKGYRPWVAPTSVSVAVLITLWSLPLIEQVSSSPGNAGQLLQFFRTATGTHHLSSVMDKMVSEFTLTKQGIISNAVSKVRPLPPATAKRWILLVALIAYNIVKASPIPARSSQRRTFEHHLATISLLAVSTVIVSGTKVAGALEGYLTLPAVTVGAVLWFSVLLGFSSLAWRKVKRWTPNEWHALARRTTVVLASVAALGFVVLTVVMRDPDASLQVPPTVDSDSSTVVQLVVEATKQARGPVRFEVEASSYSLAALLANQLELNGRSTSFDEGLDHFFGSDRRSDGCETTAIRITRAPSAVDLRLGQILWENGVETVQLRPVEGC